MLSTKNCTPKFEGKRREDDDEGDGGVAGGKGSGGGGAEGSTVVQGGNGKQQGNGSGQSAAVVGGGHQEKRSTLNDAVLPLRPIPEMTLLDQTLTSPVDSVSIKNRILHTSLSTQTMIRKWTEMDSWYGTPPRDYEDRTPSSLHEKTTPWLRSLRRTASSQDLIREAVEENSEELVTSPEEPTTPLSLMSPTPPEVTTTTTTSSSLIQNMYNDSKFSFLNTLPMEKVDRWLQCAEFVF